MSCQKQCPNPCSDYLICTCMGVMYSDICKALKEGASSFEDLSNMLQVGTGCSSCRDEIEELVVKNVKNHKN